jgi:hypothetical protein
VRTLQTIIEDALVHKGDTRQLREDRGVRPVQGGLLPPLVPDGQEKFRPSALAEALDHIVEDRVSHHSTPLASVLAFFESVRAHVKCVFLLC